MLSWLKEQWHDVKGNVKFALLVFLLGGSGGGIVTGVTALTHGLMRWQQVTIVALFVLLFFCAIAAFFWAWGMKRRHTHESPSKTAEFPLVPPPVSVVPARLADIPVPRRPPEPETNLVVEILEILFRRHSEHFLSGAGRWHIVVQLRITNRASIEPTITLWKLRLAIGLDRREADLAAIPPNWVIERQESGYGAPVTLEEIPRPTLDELASNEEFKRGKPKTGWVAFKLWTADERTVAPYNAEFTVEIKDSMGNVHAATRSAGFYVQTGQITTRPEQQATP